MMKETDKERVLDVALTVFSAGGIGGASLGSIASYAGMQEKTLDDEFGDFDGLFEAAIERGTRPLRDSIAQIHQSEAPPADRLILIARRLGELTDLERAALFTMLRGLMDGNDRIAAVFDDTLRKTFDELLLVIGEAQFRGEIAPLPPRLLAILLLSGLMFPQVLSLGSVEDDLQGVHAGHDDAPDDIRTKPRNALLAASLESLFHGLLTPQYAGVAAKFGSAES